MKNNTPGSIWINPRHFVAFGFGSGAFPFMPGTMGTLVGVLFYLGLQHFTLFNYVIVCIITFLVGVWLCGSTAEDVNVHDHPGIVWDEIVGFLITMIGAPTGWGWILFGFILFRFFDIVKPWPILTVDKKVQGGFGIMVDDLLAGLYSLIILQIVAWLFMSYD